ncbi:MAG TPA: transporter, partial [Vicinamibacterales bacterium]|nr:transporter [Vicinamibacterales bacterium]
AAAPVVALALVFASAASAQQRPLVTQDPEAIGAGNVLFETGFEYGRSIFFPASGLEGNLTRDPTLGLVVGISSIAEIQVTGGPFKRLTILDRQPAPFASLVPEGETTSAVEDLVIGTKVRLLSETESNPALALRFATRLPFGSEATGIALDTTEFYASFLVGKTMQSVRVAVNAGVAILPDPVIASRQNDVLTYGVSFTRALDPHFDVVAELNGFVNMRSEDVPLGTESQGAIRGGLRYTVGSARLDGGVIIGLTERDPGFGVTAGFTYMFKAFDVR